MNLAEARPGYGLAAAQGFASAQVGLGNMHLRGDGVPQDLAEARRLFGLAAAQGDAGAQFTLGSMHRHGHGGPPNLAEARRLFGLAAAQGNAKAQVRLGKMHHRGQGGPADFAEARRLFGLAAAQATAQTAQPVDIGSLSLDALIQMVLLNNKRACLGLTPRSPPVATQHGIKCPGMRSTEAACYTAAIRSSRPRELARSCPLGSGESPCRVRMPWE